LSMLGEIKTPTIAELFVGDLAAIGNWVVANVHSAVAWPLQVEVVDFRGHKIFLVPRSTATVVADGSTITHYPFAAVNLAAGTPFKEGCRLLSHFLSSLCWVEVGGITVEHWSGGSRAHPMGESRMGGLVTSQFELDYLPDPNDQRVRWALAFYREGLSLERSNVAYATLSFFKILNIVANTGPKQTAWINANFTNFGSNNQIKFEVTRRISELQNSGVTDIGKYLYELGRCAVAHAGTNPTVDPENPEDMERLGKDLPLIRAMAAHVIEKELRVKSRHTIWLEHLYELAGFEEILGSEVTGRLKMKDNTLNLDEINLPKRIRIALNNRPAYLPLDGLLVRCKRIIDGKIELTASSGDGLIEVDLLLDLPAERMLFDIENGLRASDDGSERSARQMAAVLQFVSDYIGNGKLHVVNAETGSLLGRKDAYIPMNIIPGLFAERYSELIEKYQAEAERRAVKTQEGVAGE
jgi:hypothetical protein